jgi:hypothetical protein
VAHQDPPPAQDLTCTVDGIESAHAVAFVDLPGGCAFTAGGSASQPDVLHSQEELQRVLHCDSDILVLPTIDFAANDVYVVTQSMGPAYAGSETLDDGTTITFLERDRPPCPNDPMAMPMNSTYAFTLPHGATRAYRSVACSLPLHCL